MNAVFQFGTKKARRIAVNPRLKGRIGAKVVNEPLPADMFVQGKKATAPEWRVAQALTKMGVEFIFQYSLFGGRVAGGVEIDFYVYTRPLPTPIWVNGDYWHKAGKNYHDALQMNKARSVFNDHAQPPVTAWERDLGSVDEAVIEMKRLLGGW